MFRFAPPHRTRKPDLTPMIDVVFLLLIFFMLASRFAQEGALPLRGSGGGLAEAWPGPPRLIDLGAGGALELNGQAVSPEHLIHMLKPLVESPDDPVIVRPRGADVQALVNLVGTLEASGFTRLVVME